VARFAALICLLALLAGCGGDDEKKPEQTVRDFVTAVRERDADTFCDELVTEEFLRQFTGASGDKSHESCKHELKTLTGLRVKLESIKKAKVNGDDATVTAVIVREGQRLRQVYKLKKEDGDWKLSGAG
jgi:predicted PilT family ATPase